MLHENVPIAFISEVLNLLRREGYAKNILHMGRGDQYKISLAGMQYVQEQLKNKSSAIAKLKERGVDWLAEDDDDVDDDDDDDGTLDSLTLFDPVDEGEVVRDSEGNPVTNNEGVPVIVTTEAPSASTVPSFSIAENDIPGANRFVTRSDNQETWDQSLKALGQVIDEFKKDHPRDNELGAEKPAMQQALEAGQKMMVAGQIQVRLGTAYIVETLKTIIERYDQTLVTIAATNYHTLVELAKAALELFKGLLG